MKKQIKISFAIIILLTLISATISAYGIKGENSNPGEAHQQNNETGWYYLPSYSNYAPNGLPDFDQRGQNDWKSRIIIWSYCAPTSLADIFWWFDSKNSDLNGTPGDGKDDFPLVRDYNAPGVPNPGPYSDDHNFNNVNSRETPSKKGELSGELIERIAWYINHNNKQGKLRFFFWGGTKTYDMKKGVQRWLEDSGLENKYNVEQQSKPSFSYICQKLRGDLGIVLLLRFNNPFIRFYPMFCGHYVAVAGVNQRDGYIALSDPFLNTVNPDPTPLEHNNPSVVSHDVYKIDSTSPRMLRASWWLPGYSYTGAYATYAFVISEV